ncbi:unnamed protein product [Paramecium octaurelia]|uniref:Uncharacterized protein n=1 Tax=Paramecium octaurelia TaxID=43137 RepID=A0A8S1VVT3_PAROT|nr:unnamed protein product [Paramecium octaurelia]
MGCCNASSKQKLPNSTSVPREIKISSQQEWDIQLNRHYQSILNSSIFHQNFSIDIVNEVNSEQDNLVIIIQGSYLEQLQLGK